MCKASSHFTQSVRARANVQERLHASCNIISTSFSRHADVASPFANRQWGKPEVYKIPGSGILDRHTQSSDSTSLLVFAVAVACENEASESNFRHPLLQHVGSSVAPALQKLIADAESLPGSTDPSQLGWTTLGACKRMFDAATSGALQAGGLSRLIGKVVRLTPNGAHWVATVDSHQGQKCVKVRCVVLATGAEPKVAPLPNALSAEKTFDEDSLRHQLRPNQRLAVLGNSHTAAVALAKLRELAVPMLLSITCFARRPLRCAEWLEHSQVYRYNSTGLKGFGAVFGRECMIHGTSWLQVKDVKDFSPEHWDWIIDCTGYVKSQLPAIDGVIKAQDLPRDEASGALLGAPPGLFALGVPWGEAPGRLWGRGLEAEDGFRGEDTFVGFSMFFARANLLADEKSQQLREKPAECKIVIDDSAVAHVEISGICTPKSLERVLNALHDARCKDGVKAVVLILQGSKGPVTPAGPGLGGASPQTQAVASGTFLLGLRTLGLPCVAACCGKVAGPAWGLVLAADYRIASATSNFILPIWGPPECFGDLVGHTVAMQLCYNQGPVNALSMLEYGVIHQCQRGDEDTKKAAAEVARRIAATPALACHQATAMLSPAIEKYASIVARGGLRA
ncbi:hypothetical protein AK812_SmicGene39154 [Symbiodinium microadriaticum]|uniref:L-ornithine N(5)-oxygenase n=1 Tax=Symbiodinium microadriaticum TaxID=2951 RepID=A0A1Q9CC88_SYMMI|nr:hypothetical protein AK812_SmicGene39154 [Symbiodinium microadriaticum]